MRKNIVLFGLIGILFSALGITSCAPDYQTDFEVKTLNVPDNSLAPVFFPISGGESVAKVQASNLALSEWKASSNAAWLTIDKKEGQVTMSAGSNNTYAPRIARVSIEYGHQAYYINVTQAGNVPYLLVDGEQSGVIKSFPSGKATTSVRVKSNMSVDHILIPDTSAFITVDKVTEVNAEEKIVSFNIDQNFGRKKRYGIITFQSSDNYAYTASFMIVQDEMVMKQIPLREDMLSTNAQEPSEGPIRNLLDGNAGSHFHSLWSSSISEMHYIQVKLDEPIPGCVFWYQNRNNGNGKPTDVSIKVSADGETWSEMAHITSGLPTAAGSTYESAFLRSEAPFKYFRFIVNRTNDGAGPRFFNMAEFKMYAPE